MTQIVFSAFQCEVLEDVIKQLSELTALKVRQTQETKFFITPTKVITISEEPIVTSIELFHGGIEVTATGWSRDFYVEGILAHSAKTQTSTLFRIRYSELEETILKLKALAESRR